MCNLYSVKPSREELKALASAMGEWSDEGMGNYPPLPAVFPNKAAPVVRALPNGVRQALNMRWGFPPPKHPRKQAAQPVPHQRAKHRQPLLAELPTEVGASLPSASD